jgi:signal transduction histidine kinase
MVAVLIATVAALHYTKSSVLSDEKKFLVERTRALSREYAARADFAQQNAQNPPLREPGAQFSNGVLTVLSQVTLQNDEGVEGGFYAASSDSLLGYSAPTLGFDHATLDDELGADRQPILTAARDAASTNQPSQKILAGGAGVVLIEAVPIHDIQGVAGSAWTLKRIATLPGSNRRRAYLLAVALGAAALISVLLTLLVTRNLQSGVTKVENGLANLERQLSSRIPIGEDPLEIRRIASGINRLGAALEEKIESEKQIEDQLRHAERLAALGRLIAGVAHEVRNPLATIRLRVQMCQQISEDPALQDSCAVALEEIERLNGMVNRLLNFSQPVHLLVEPVNICQLLEQRLARSAERARNYRIRIVTNFQRPACGLRADPARIAQVFDNVIQNAIESMAQSGGTLCVSVASNSHVAQGRQDVAVEFNDTGSGIDPAILNRIFDPFFTTKPTGTGLGLSICRELVRAHGGEINLRSANGHGTTVRIVLPVPQERARAGAA